MKPPLLQGKPISSAAPRLEVTSCLSSPQSSSVPNHSLLPVSPAKRKLISCGSHKRLRSFESAICWSLAEKDERDVRVETGAVNCKAAIKGFSRRTSSILSVFSYATSQKSPRFCFCYSPETSKISLILPVLGSSPMRCLSCFYVPSLSLSLPLSLSPSLSLSPKLTHQFPQKAHVLRTE